MAFENHGYIRGPVDLGSLPILTKDDLLDLPGPRGRVTLHPIHLRSALGKDPNVVAFQVTALEACLDVQVVLAHNAPVELTTALARTLDATLRAQGAEFPVRIRTVAAIARESAAGKLKLVRDLS